ncbi:MAG: bifunctional phosphoglucose/phosphomannose isomerase, partial [Candidatus Heimdallarchaeaceae archaeon]
MIDLDSLEQIRQIDLSNQLSIMQKWPELIIEARNQSLALSIPSHYKWKNSEISYQLPSTIVICGMGGSAIAGDYLKELVREELKIPIIVNRDYNLPQFVNENTLTICISYSGNTEETLSCFYDALLKKSMIIAISSGGLLEELSAGLKIPHIKIRAGQAPRTALPLTYISLLTILEKFTLIPNLDEQVNEAKDVLESLADELKPETKIEKNIAKNLALSLYNS